MIAAALLAVGLAAAQAPPDLPAAGGPELALVFFGDGGTGREPQRQVAEAVRVHCVEHRCDALVLLGDTIAPHGVRSAEDPQWQRKLEAPYAGLDLPFLAALGNHDREGSWQAQIAYTEHSARWWLPQRYYALEAGPVHLFVLDTTELDRAQRRGVRRGLRASTAPWVVVAGHHPYLSYGRHGSDPRLARRLRMVRRHADLVLAGHDHDQQVLQDPRGPTVVVMGSGGARPRPVDPGPETRFAASQRGFGWLSLGVAGGTLEVRSAEGALVYEAELEPR